jgi:hypothetical protein
LAGPDNIERLLHIDVPVNSFPFSSIKVNGSFYFQVNLSKLRYFYIDEIDAYFINKVDHDQKAAHRRVRYIFIFQTYRFLHLTGR